MDTPLDEIARALGAQFDGFYEGDVAKLERIFRPNAHLYTAADGPLRDDTMGAVCARVRGHTPPPPRSARPP